MRITAPYTFGLFGLTVATSLSYAIHCCWGDLTWQKIRNNMLNGYGYSTIVLFAGASLNELAIIFGQKYCLKN